MKKLFFGILSISILISGAVFADSASPEFYPVQRTEEINPLIYVLLAILIVVISCVSSVLVNKKVNKNREEQK